MHYWSRLLKIASIFFFSYNRVFDQCCHTSFEPKNFMQRSFKIKPALQVYLLTALHVCSGCLTIFLQHLLLR